MESVPYNVVEKVLRVVFSDTEPYPPHRTMWAKRNPENTFNFYVYNDGEWHDVSGTITIPEISVFLSAFENDAGFLTADDITGLQEALVSGENIKTINGQSIVGSGNLVINGGGTGLDSAFEEITISEPISKNNSGYYNLPSTIYETALTAWQTGRIPVLNADLSSDTTMFSSPLVYINSNFVGYFHKSGANKTHFVCTIGSASATINVDYEQDKLESGVNIKTINNQSLLGSGNITIDNIPLSSLEANVASGIVYDVTTNNAGATFASLSALLSSGSLSTIIPTDVRKGGMQIRFVLSSDNNYVQFRYMKSDAETNATFTNVANWQGVEFTPTADSNGLVASNGLCANYLTKKTGKNILNVEGLENGGLNTNGKADSSTSFSHTVFIPIKPSTQYFCTKSDSDHFGGGSYQHCFYDKNFNLVHTVASTSNHFTTQETVAYAKFTIRNTSLALLPMVNEGNARGNYEPYDALFGYTGAIRREISGIKQNYVPVSLSKNLLDVSSLTVGYLYGNGSENNTGNSYRKSGYIPVSEGNYYLSSVSQKVQGSDVPIFAFYDAEYNYVGKQQWSPLGVTGIQISVPSGASFVRLTLYTASIDDSLQFEAGTQRTSYEPYSLIYGYNKGILNNIRELTPAKNAVGNGGLSASAATLTNNSLSISGFPQYIKSNGIVSGGGKITQFNQVIVGYGYGETFGKYAKVDATNITLCSTSSNGTERVVETVAHKLTISEFIDVVLSVDGYVVTVIVSTLGGYKTITHTYTDVDSGNGLVESMSGTPSIVADSTTSLTNVSIRTTSDSFRLPIWVFGDSYTSQNTERWPYYARYQFGINALWVGKSGGQSSHLFPDLENALSFGCPKFLVWCLGMNDSYANYQSYFAKVKDICEQNGIELIAGTIPLVPVSGYADKNEDINDYIKASGVRYIDFAAAVGADTTSTWYDGCLSNDDIHPTAKGAKCLFAGAFKDFPEMMQYGIQPK